MESSLIKKQYPGILGWVLSIVLIFGYLIRIMHWSYYKETIFISTFLLVGNLIYFAIIEKNKLLINYLLIGYLVTRVATVFFKVDHFFWWLDLILGFTIVCCGFVSSFRIMKQLFNS